MNRYAAAAHKKATAESLIASGWRKRTPKPSNAITIQPPTMNAAHINTGSCLGTTRSPTNPAHEYDSKPMGRKQAKTRAKQIAMFLLTKF
jgi:hypothetical protein